MSLYEKSPSHTLSRTAFMMMAKGNECLKLYMITGAQMYVMMQLWENEGRKMTHKQIYSLMDIKPPSLTKLINQLENKGYITKRNDPEDKRSTVISLTKAGMLLKERTMEFGAEFEKKMFSGIISQDIKTLKKVLLKIQENLSKM